MYDFDDELEEEEPDDLFGFCDDELEEEEHEEEPAAEPIKRRRKITKRVSRPTMRKTGKGIIQALALAIQHHEGFFPPSASYPRGSKSFRNNNPGNLRYVGQVGSKGQDSTGFAVFPDYQSGFTALLRDIDIKLKRSGDMTITQLLNVYAPPSENDTGAYIDAVAAELGIDKDKPIKNA